MNHEEFRDLWLNALRSARLPIPYPIGATERLDLRNMSREYTLPIITSAQPKYPPFHISLILEWVWDAQLFARFDTTEEDLLMLISGDFDVIEDSVQPWIRLDARLSAGSPYGTVFPVPAPEQWQRWERQVQRKVQTLLPDTYKSEETILGSSQPQARFDCLKDGQLSLQSVSFHAWQLFRLPRQWDDPNKHDPSPEPALVDFAGRLARAMTAWEDCLVHLLPGKEPANAN